MTVTSYFSDSETSNKLLLKSNFPNSDYDLIILSVLK